MTPNRLGLLALTLCLGISGCTSVVNASREAPIEDDRGTRTFGSSYTDVYQSMYSNSFTIFCTPETPCTRLVA